MFWGGNLCLTASTIIIMLNTKVKLLFSVSLTVYDEI